MNFNPARIRVAETIIKDTCTVQEDPPGAVLEFWVGKGVRSLFGLSPGGTRGGEGFSLWK